MYKSKTEAGTGRVIPLNETAIAALEAHAACRVPATVSIAGHVSRAMLSRYSHVGMEAKRRALDEIAARQCATDEKRKEEAERREQVAAVAQSGVIQ